MNLTASPQELSRPTPKISALMSVFNGEPYLREAVDSILNQTWDDFEFIIVDDCSTDNTAKILDSYNDPRIVRLYNHSNLGLTRSLNRGLGVCRGEIIARQDADDVSMPSRFKEQLDYLERRPDIGVLGTQMDTINEAGELTGKYEVPSSASMAAWQLFFGRSLAHPTVMIRQAWLEQVGGYDPAFPYIEDFELWTRLVEVTKISNLGISLYKYRCRRDSISGTKSKEQLANITAVRRLFASRLLEREIPLYLCEWLHNSQLPENRLTDKQRLEVIPLILDLKNGMEQKGLIEAKESGEVQADMLARIGAASGQVPAERGTPSLYASCIRPFQLVAKAVANPKRAKQALGRRTGDWLSRLRGEVQLPQPGAAAVAAPATAGVTVIVLTYNRMAGLTALLRSLLEQDMGGLPLELIVCNNSPRVQLKRSRFSSLGRLLSRFEAPKIFNSSHNWRCRVRYAVGTLAAYDTIMFIDDDITLLNKKFISYMYENFRTLGPMDLLSCWNTLWLDWNEDNYSCVSLDFETAAITRLTQTDTIGAGICMFNKRLLANPRILDLSRGFPKADDMAFPLVAALEWGSRSYFLPSLEMLTMHYERHRHALYYVQGHTDDLYAQFKSLLKEGYQPVLSRSAADASPGESPEQYAAQVLTAVTHSWK